MISLWFLVIGIIFGILSSFYAKKNDLKAENWFTIGLFFWFFAPLAIFVIVSKAQIKESHDRDEEFSFPY